MSEYVHNKSIWYPVSDEDLTLMSEYLEEKILGILSIQTLGKE